MAEKMVDVVLHIDETIDQATRQALCDSFLHTHGVVAANADERMPHLMVIEYDPDTIVSTQLLAIARQNGLHGQLIGL